MCPPYELVDYEEIFDLLHDSPLLHEVGVSAAERDLSCVAAPASRTLLNGPACSPCCLFLLAESCHLWNLPVLSWGAGVHCDCGVSQEAGQPDPGQAGAPGEAAGQAVWAHLHGYLWPSSCGGLGLKLWGSRVLNGSSFHCIHCWRCKHRRRRIAALFRFNYSIVGALLLEPLSRSQTAAMQAAAVAPQVVRAALTRPLTRSISSKLAAHVAPWPQRQRTARGGVVAQARNRLADLLADLKSEDVDDESTAPIGAPPLLPPPCAACLKHGCGQAADCCSLQLQSWSGKRRWVCCRTPTLAYEPPTHALAVLTMTCGGWQRRCLK